MNVTHFVLATNAHLGNVTSPWIVNDHQTSNAAQRTVDVAASHNVQHCQSHAQFPKTMSWFLVLKTSVYVFISIFVFYRKLILDI